MAPKSAKPTGNQPAAGTESKAPINRAGAESGQPAEGEIVGFQEPAGVDWSALKGKLIRLPVIGRALRIAMAILRLPKRLDAITDSISLLSDQNIDLETKLHSEISALQTRQQQLKLALQTGKDGMEDSEESDLLSDYFHALAERFRGPYDQVKAKMALYLPILAEEAVDFRQYPAVDLACGRCEWSDLLRENGITCTGVDANPVVLRTAKANDLPVYCGDIFTYMESLADASIGIVSGFHIIEHLPTAQKLQLFKEAERVLVPGGLLILETPNSENPLVSSHYFYLDPSHLNPVPIPALEFMAEHFGFETAQVLRHSPMEHSQLSANHDQNGGQSEDQNGGEGESPSESQGLAQDVRPAEAYLKEWLSKEQDYGLVARKKPLGDQPDQQPESTPS